MCIAALPALGSAFGSMTGLQQFGMIASIGSTLLGAKSAADQAATSKQVAKNNAALSEYAARDAERRGEEAAQEALRKGAAVKSAQRVTMAAHGLDLSYGTAADLQEQTDFFAGQDATTARENASKEAWSRRQQGANFKAEASSYNPFMAGATGLLSGAGAVADKWYAYTKKPTDPTPSRLTAGLVL